MKHIGGDDPGLTNRQPRARTERTHPHKSKTQPIRYAVDVTLDDVEATFTFLQDQLIGRHWKVGTEEYRTNNALRGAVSSFIGSLRYSLGKDAIANAAGTG